MNGDPERSRQNRRTRDGCDTCKRRKKKCDGKAPSCANCERLGLACNRTGIKLVWEDDRRRDGMRRRGPGRHDEQHGTGEDTDPWDPSGAANGTVESDVGQDGSSLFPETDAWTRPNVDTSGSNIPAGGPPDWTLQRVNDRATSTQTAFLGQALSAYPHLSSPTQALLFDRYVQRFSKTYPTFSGPENPFISVLLPLAMNNETVLTSLLALSGVQTWGSAGNGVEEETLKLRQGALRGLRKQLQRHGIVPSNAGPRRLSDAQDHTSSSGQPSRASVVLGTMDEVDVLYLLSTAIMLLLYEKLSGEDERNWKPHLDFICKVFSYWPVNYPETRADGSSSSSRAALLGSRTPQVAKAFRFLHSLFLYNDLVGSTSLQTSTLSNYYTQVTGAIPGLQGSSIGAIGFDHGNLGVSDNSASRYYFPSLIARISAGDTSVTTSDIDMWDGRLDWLPSFSLVESPGRGDVNEFGGNPFSDQAIVSNIYRTAAIVYRQSMQHPDTNRWEASPVSETDPLASSPDAIGTDQRRSQRKSAIGLIKLLPEGSPWENALLWPIGIVAKHLTVEDMADRQYILQRLQSLEKRFQMKHFRRAQEILQHRWTDIDRPLSAPGFATVSILQG